MRPRTKRSQSQFVVGVGINAMDTIIRLPRFPAPDSKMELVSAESMPGGQVASAMVACRRWGLHARYIGKIGGDAPGRQHVEIMKRERVDARWIIAKGLRSQFSFILVDQSSGDRTVLWNRNPAIALRPQDIKRSWIRGAAALLVDGHDTEAAAQAARWARGSAIPVVADLDNRYPRVEALLEYVDYPITSKDFPERLTGERDLLKSLPMIHAQFKCRLTIATLGRNGVIAWDGQQFLQSPALSVNAVDTTGAGDIFHGAFLYGLVQRWPLQELLEFSCAAAALNCEAPGARGGIAPIKKITELRRNGARLPLAYSAAELNEAARAAPPANGAPFVTVLLIIINFVVFFHQIALSPAAGDAFVHVYGLVPRRIVVALSGGHYTLAQAFIPLFTCMFLHGGWLHIIGNMWFLWIFGGNVEDRMGPASYLLFYLLCGLGSGISQVAFSWSSAIPSIGASGAISGVLGAYIVFFPGSRILSLVPLLVIWFLWRVPAWIFIGLWFLMQFLSGLGSLAAANAAASGGVAWWAHVGGFILGALLAKPFASPPRRAASAW